MGTVYHITVIPEKNHNYKTLEDSIKLKLENINSSMSMFDRNSELSRFNTCTKSEKFCVSDSFMEVFRTGYNLYGITDGAWDGTVGPLVNIWGFGPDEKKDFLPSDSDIEKALSFVGFNLIEISDETCLIKKKDDIKLDFGSIAKGYAVDEIVRLCDGYGIKNYLVEIGGEVRAGGTNNGRSWKVGISLPDPGFPAGNLLATIVLENRAIATSGDYRNYRKLENFTFSHGIDPRTGRPVQNDVASVSVVADSAVYADGLATALMIMGEEKGIELVNRLNGVQCLFVLREKKERGEDSLFRISTSYDFPQLKKTENRF